MKCAAGPMEQPPVLPRLSGPVPALNGMRGVAVLLVFFFHAGVPGFGGAFIGVDIFFILSGFLITALLLQEYQHHSRIHLKQFYLRRILRLFPALLLLLVVYLVFFFSRFPDPASRLHHLQDALIALFYAANWTRAFDLGRPDVLGHCWSLSIEEQFYALWPMLLLGLLRFPGRRRSFAILLLFLASWGWRLFLLERGAGWDRVYNGFDTRADMLLAGCLLASLWHDGHLARWARSRLWSPLLAGASAAALALLAVYGNWQAAALYRWQYALVALATTLLILDLLSRPRGFLSRALSWAPLAWIGTVSYGIYLWHYPVLHGVALYGLQGATLVWVVAAVTMAGTLFSWHVVERPALRLKARFSPK